MITWVRTANIAQGKAMPAMEWALKVTGYVNDHFGTNVAVQRNVGGPLNQLHWVGTYDSLAQFEETSNRIFADPGYQRMVAEATEQQLYMSDIVDSMYQTVSA